MIARHRIGKVTLLLLCPELARSDSLAARMLSLHLALTALCSHEAWGSVPGNSNHTNNEALKARFNAA
jgi:hypothetical protein